MPKSGAKYLETLDWVAPAQLGGNQDELYQTIGCKALVSHLDAKSMRAAHSSRYIESIYRPVPSSDGSRGIATAGAWESSSRAGFIQYCLTSKDHSAH